jgi:membrane fusion protein, multidrug efflux system
MAKQDLKKRLLVMGLFLILLFGGLFGFDLFRKIQMGKSFASYRPPPVPVTALRIEPAALPRSLEAVGSLEAVRQVVLAAEVDGRITELHFKPGSTVRQGQPLVQLNDGPERGDLKRLQAQKKLARINVDRSQQLLKLAVPQSEFDAQLAQLDSVDGDIARVEAVLAQKLIRAPFNGSLGVQSIHIGDYVRAGDTLVTLTDLNSLYLNMTLPEQWHGQLLVGQSVQFDVDALPKRQFTARIVAIEPQIGTDTRSIRLQAQLDNPKHLLAPGMFARAALQLPAEKDVLSVPDTAIEYSIHGDAVYVISKSQPKENGAAPAASGEQLVATRALVKTDGRVGDRVIIRSGLKAGDLIVTAGQLKLHDGAPVQVVSADTLDAAAKKAQGRLE